jgi:hypothetical protein
MMPQTSAGQPAGLNLSVLSTRVEVVADYSADTRAGRTVARATSVPDGQSEIAGAFDRLDETADRDIGKKYKVSIVVRNDGPRAIGAVTFEYLLGYAHGRRPPERLTFKVRREIKPGEALTLSHTFVSAKHVVLRSREQANVKSIEYKDGSIWRR